MASFTTLLIPLFFFCPAHTLPEPLLEPWQREIARVPAAEMTRARLLSALRAGELLLIEGGISSWRALEVWSLAWFEERFPNAPVEFRDEGSQLPETIALSENLTLGTYRARAGARGTPWYVGWGNQDANVSATHFAPYMGVPPFFPASFSTQGFRTEWLYFGSHGSGVPFHTDPQCHPKFSAHISGDTRWLLREEWRRPLGPAGDAAADVEWVATVRRGDVLIFFPQFHHSTLVLSEEGSLAYTGYIISPRDTPFIQDLIAASRASPPFAAAYRKCHAEGATLESMGKTCADCRGLPAGHPLRPALCDREQGRRMCADLAGGRIEEAETPWDESRGRRKRRKRSGERQSVSFSLPVEGPN
jgi:hypothetical protein